VSATIRTRQQAIDWITAHPDARDGRGRPIDQLLDTVDLVREVNEARARTLTYRPVDDDLAGDLLGEGFHTAFRKGVDGKGSGTVWDAIRDMTDDGYSDAIDYVLYALDYMGYKLCEEVES